MTVSQTRLSQRLSASHDDVMTRLGHDRNWLQGLALFMEA